MREEKILAKNDIIMLILTNCQQRDQRLSLFSASLNGNDNKHSYS